MARVGGLSSFQFHANPENEFKSPTGTEKWVCIPRLGMTVYSLGLGPNGQRVSHYLLHLALWNPDAGNGLVQHRMWHMISRNHTHAFPSYSSTQACFGCKPCPQELLHHLLTCPIWLIRTINSVLQY